MTYGCLKGAWSSDNIGIIVGDCEGSDKMFSI